jgi:hypothetical protein
MIFPRFGTPRILITDGGTHFTRMNFKKCLSMLGIELSSTNQRTSGNIEKATKEHPQQNHREGSQGLVKEIRWCFVGISNGVQDTDRYDSLSICIWQSLEHKAYWAIKEMNLDLDVAVVK